MGGKTTDQGNIAYEDRSGWSKRRVLQTGADRAEWDIPEGRIGGLVRQQRRRAHIAAQRGRWLFSLLFAVIAIGLGYYVGLPIWQQVQDASKRSLEAEARLLESQRAQFDTARNAAWEDLKASLRFVLRPQNYGLKTTFDGYLTANNQTRLLLVLEDGTLTYTDTAGDVWVKPELPEPVDDRQQPLSIIQKLDNETNLIAFSKARDPVSTSFSSEKFAFPTLVSDDAGTTWRGSEFPASLPRLRRSIQLYQRDGVSIRRVDNVIARTEDYGATWQIVTLEAEPIERLQIRQINPNALVARGDLGDLAFSRDAGRTWVDLVVPDASNERILIETITESEITIRAGDSQLISTDNGKSWNNIIADADLEEPIVIEPVVIEEPEAIFSFDLGDVGYRLFSNGSRQLIRRQNPATGELTTVFAPNTELATEREYLLTDGVTTAIFPTNRTDGTVAFAGTADGGRTWREYPSIIQDLASFEITDLVKSVDGTKALAFDQFGSGNFARLDDIFLQDIEGVTLEDAQPGDTQAREYLAGLPIELKEDSALRPRITALEAAIQNGAQGRAGIDAERDAKLAEASEIGGTGFSLSQRRRDYQQFMEVCQAGATDATTCTDGYIKLRETEKDDIWQFVAERAPQAVLLLFLLATLAGLYRYNLRLSGFHHSRADALELLSVIHGNAEKLSKDDLVAFAALADQMAADKVEFGKSGTPSDQAVELARIITQRS